MASSVMAAPCSLVSSHRILRNCGWGFIGSRRPQRAADLDRQLPLYRFRKRSGLRSPLAGEGNEHVMLEARRESTGELRLGHLSSFVPEHTSSMEYRGSPFTSAVYGLVWRSSTGSGGSDPMSEEAGSIDQRLHADTFLEQGARGVPNRAQAVCCQGLDR